MKLAFNRRQEDISQKFVSADFAVTDRFFRGFVNDNKTTMLFVC